MAKQKTLYTVELDSPAPYGSITGVFMAKPGKLSVRYLWGDEHWESEFDYRLHLTLSLGGYFYRITRKEFLALVKKMKGPKPV